MSDGIREIPQEPIDVSAWRKAMEGVTPGPWAAFTDDSGHSPHTNIVAVVPITACVFSLAGRNKREADVEWISRCSPSAVSALLDEIDRLRAGPQECGAIIHAVASLAAAISLLERTPKANKAAPSDRMFDQMLKDYRKALDDARQAIGSSGRNLADANSKSPIQAREE